MSSDFGDDSGEAMLRWAERVGARALIVLASGDISRSTVGLN